MNGRGFLVRGFNASSPVTTYEIKCWLKKNVGKLLFYKQLRSICDVCSRR